MRFRHHKYTWTKPFGNVRHSWEFVGPVGGVSYNATIYQGRASCGLEFHHSARAGFYCDEAPHHLKCPLLGEPCWHDGTSLYATDDLWPMIEAVLRSGDHDQIFRFLEQEYDRRFGHKRDAA